MSARFRRHIRQIKQTRFCRLLDVDASFKAQLSDLLALSPDQLRTTDYNTRMHGPTLQAWSPAAVFYLLPTLLCKHVLSPPPRPQPTPKKKASCVSFKLTIPSPDFPTTNEGELTRRVFAGSEGCRHEQRHGSDGRSTHGTVCEGLGAVWAGCLVAAGSEIRLWALRGPWEPLHRPEYPLPVWRRGWRVRAERVVGGGGGGGG